MNRFFGNLLVLLTVAVVITFVTILWPRQSPTASAVKPAGESQLAKFVRASTPVLKSDPAQHLAAALVQISNSQDGKTNRQALAELRQFLDSLSPNVASREVQKFLTPNTDAATPLGLTVKLRGQLGDASSLRVLLLDYLGQIDRAVAGEIATQILAQYTTPDEWAVSLRNYAWANPGPGGEAYLQAKSRGLLGNPAWRKNPSAGFHEAFDTIVHARGTALAPELAALARDKENGAAQCATGFPAFASCLHWLESPCYIVSPASNGSFDDIPDTMT